MSEQISAGQCLYVLRRQRHSFLNHLQVISGWLQLDQPERARQYLETVAARMIGESGVLRQAPASLGLLILELGLEAETHGVTLEWSAEGSDLTHDEEELALLRHQVQAALTSGCGGVVSVRLAANGFSVHTPSGKGEG